MVRHSTRRLKTLGCLCIASAAILLSACHHKNRIAPSALQRLREKNIPFTLIFGEFGTEGRELATPTVRVVRQLTTGSPEYVLWSGSVKSNGSFFAALQPPPDLSYLDQFYVEAGDPAIGFERVMFVRLEKDDPPVAMYVGDLHIRQAPYRTVQGQTVKVDVRDNFDAASRELKRLYPHFDVPITKAALFRNAPVTPTVERR